MPGSEVGGPVPQEARQGRHRQRYGEGGERLGKLPILQAPQAALPFVM